jgi:methyl-accepting chemotaxis protein
LDLSEQTVWIVVSFAAVGVVANLSLVRLLSVQWYKPWLIYAYCFLDVSLVGLAILYLGPGGVIAGFFLVIVPCALRPSRALGAFALVASAVVFVAAATLHGLLDSPNDVSPGTSSRVFLDLAFLVGVAAVLVATNTELFARINIIHSSIRRVGAGALGPMSLTLRNDSLGLVEQSLNEMLEQIGSLVDAVRREAHEVAILGGSFADSTGIAVESSERVASMASRLSTELLDFKKNAEAGQVECNETARVAIQMQTRADGSAGNVRELEESAELGRDYVARTIETVLAIGADIDRTAGIVDELSVLSRQIGSSALSIAKIARHTHVLALNAAIEAARAEEHGDEFAVVADQVRTLAGEAGRSARDVSDLVTEINAGIAAAASAMAGGEEKVIEAKQTAGEARTALANVRSGSATASDFLTETAESSQAQAKHANSFADLMAQFASASARWSTEIQAASKDASEQTSQMRDFDRSCEQLADVAKRLKEAADRFSTTRS